MARSLALLLIGALFGGSIVYIVMRDGNADATRRLSTPDAAAQAVFTPIEAVASAAPSNAADVTKVAGSAMAPLRSSLPAAGAQTVPPVTQDGPVSAAVAGSDPDALIVPVSGIDPSRLVDTFTDARDRGRVHDAIDIMAASGTPVVATADGRVEKLFTSDKGGLTIYQFANHGDRGFYYAHLQAYANGLVEKQQVQRGDVIGYVGSTGNADPSAPHLHFEVFVLGPERQWWKTRPLNPYPLLGGR